MNRRLAAEQSARISSQRENKGNQLPSVPPGERVRLSCAQLGGRRGSTKQLPGRRRTPKGRQAMGSSAGRIVDGRRCWSLGEEGRREAGEDGDEREDAAGLRHWTGLGWAGCWLAGWLGCPGEGNGWSQWVGGSEGRGSGGTGGTRGTRGGTGSLLAPRVPLPRPLGWAGQTGLGLLDGGPDRGGGVACGKVPAVPVVPVVPVRSRRGEARHHTVAAAAVTRSPARSGCSQLAAEVDVVEGVGAMARGGSPHHHGWQAEVVPHAAHLHPRLPCAGWRPKNRARGGQVL